MVRTNVQRSMWARLALAATAMVAASVATPASADPIQFDSFSGALSDSTGQPVRQAGSHPDVQVSFRVPQLTPGVLVDEPHRMIVDVPPGLVGNPRAAETCSELAMTAGPGGKAAYCPVESQVGTAQVIDTSGTAFQTAPVFNVERPDDAPALFAFNYLGTIVKLRPSVRASDYGITIDSGILSKALKVAGADVTLWGVPADSSHDDFRAVPGVSALTCLVPGMPCISGGETVSSTPRPMLSLGTECTGEPLMTRGRLDGWSDIGSFASSSFDADRNGVPMTLTGCDRLEFAPSIDVAPRSRTADAPTGLEVDLRVPQSDNAGALASAHVKDVKMVLPEGMSVAPGSAAGLGACSPAEIGLGTDAPANCPRSSKLGTVAVESPLLDEPMTGDVILATPDQNPFGSLVALYIVAEGSGVRIKLAGRVDPNPFTGQLTATFSSNPQLPFSALKVRFDGGENASLATPTACGRYETKTEITSWSGKTVNLTSPMVIDQNCTSSPRGFAPGVNAGSVTPLAAKDSAFVLNLDRPDGQQNLGSVGVKMPPGLLARIGDIALCAEHDAAVGSCSANSLVGQVETTAGPGSAPLPVRGKAFLTGPYKGGPYGLSIVVPTAGQAGPFDLGNVVVRARIEVDRKDAHVTVTSDPMPTILRGFPLRIRQVRVAIDHGRFMLNPSSCKQKHVGVWMHGTEGGNHGAQIPYRVSGCGDLEQDQKITLGFTNKTQQRPGKHPGVEAKLTSKGPGMANLEKVVVKLPLSVALDPKNAKALCKPEEREALNCPADSIIGRASAKSVLKDELSGPIYFVQGTRKTASGRVVETLPKLWIPLSGGGVTIDVNADSHVSQRKLVSTFKDLPDAPITEFKLRINSGRNGILTVPPSKDGGTCQRDRNVYMQLTGHNGAVKTVRTKAKVAGCKAKSKKKSGKKATAKKASAKQAAARRP